MNPAKRQTLRPLFSSKVFEIDEKVELKGIHVCSCGIKYYIIKKKPPLGIAPFTYCTCGQHIPGLAFSTTRFKRLTR